MVTIFIKQGSDNVNNFIISVIFHLDSKISLVYQNVDIFQLVSTGKCHVVDSLLDPITMREKAGKELLWMVRKILIAVFPICDIDILVGDILLLFFLVLGYWRCFLRVEKISVQAVGNICFLFKIESWS